MEIRHSGTWSASVNFTRLLTGHGKCRIKVAGRLAENSDRTLRLRKRVSREPHKLWISTWAGTMRQGVAVLWGGLPGVAEFEQGRKFVMRRASLLLFLSLMIMPFNTHAGSFFCDGIVDNSDGTPSSSLEAEGFKITQDGHVTGYIINVSNRPLAGVRIDMWTTTPEETRIFWRKTLNIGDIAPGGKYEVREIYEPGPDDISRIKFKFRIPSTANYRNPRK